MIGDCVDATAATMRCVIDLGKKITCSPNNVVHRLTAAFLHNSQPDVYIAKIMYGTAADSIKLTVKTSGWAQDKSIEHITTVYTAASGISLRSLFPQSMTATPELLTGDSTDLASDLLDDLHDVLVLQAVVLADLLGPVPDGCAPHECILELLRDALVDAIAEVLHRVAPRWHHHRIVVVRQPPLPQPRI